MQCQLLSHAAIFLAIAVGMVHAQADRIGCYNDAGTFEQQGVSVYQSTGTCLVECRRVGAAFAAVHNGNECWCGSSEPPNEGKVPISKCDLPCPGYPTDNCGGQAAWAVYAADDTDETGSDTTPCISHASSTQISETLALPTVTLTTSVPTSPPSGFSSTPTPSISTPADALTPSFTDTVITISSTPAVNPTIFTGAANRGPRILFF